MERAKAHPLPARDPISGGPLVITEMEAVESGVTIRGRFEVPRFARLSPDQARYLETFLKCRGMLNSVERELGISYPTARARLDAVLRALDLHAVREDAPPTPPAVPLPPEGLHEPGEEFAPDEARPEEAAPEYEAPAWQAPSDEGDDRPEPETRGPFIESEPQATTISRSEILSLLERGEITVEEAKQKLGNAR